MSLFSLITIRALLASVACASACLAQAQGFPAAGKPIRIVVPFTAGGSSDFVARTLATKLTDTMKHSVIVDNRPGGNTLICAEHVAKSPPDGHTLFLVGVITHASTPALSKKCRSTWSRTSPSSPMRLNRAW